LEISPGNFPPLISPAVHPVSGESGLTEDAFCALRRWSASQRRNVTESRENTELCFMGSLCTVSPILTYLCFSSLGCNLSGDACHGIEMVSTARTQQDGHFCLCR